MDNSFVVRFTLDPYVTAFDMDKEHIFLLAGLTVVKLDKTENKIVGEKILFQKEGKSRSLIADDTFVYVKDFCDLHILEKETLALIQKIHLGTDLSSDICGMGVDEDYLYLSIRNGSMAKIHTKHPFQTEMYPVTDSSIWNFAIANDFIYAGNVNGDLLIIDKASMGVVKKIESGKQNLKSVLLTGDLLITASQDKKMTVRDAKNYEVIQSLGNVHRKAFSIVGVYEGQIYTLSRACAEIKVWDSKSWKLIETITIPWGCTQARIQENRLYLAAEDIRGLAYKDL